MKKLVMFVYAVIVFSLASEAKVNVITKNLVVYPQKDVGNIARIVFDTDSEGSFLFLIKDSKGNIVRALPKAKIPAGQSYVDWDGKDFAGNFVSEGEYRVSIISGILWKIDDKFGKNGRIGLETAEFKITDPEKIIFKVPGEIKRITAGEVEYYKTDNLSIAGPNYIVKDGMVQLNPTGGAKKDDIVKIEYYYPCFLENPWTIDVDDAGNLYVVYKWKTESMKYPAGNLVKISSDGNKIVNDFGVNGKIGPFAGNYSCQVLLNEKEGKIYIAGSHDSGHGTGVFSMNTGAFFYSIGGWFGGGKDPATTPFSSGISFGPENKIYIQPFSGFSAYDRTKEKEKGFLYRENAIKRHSGYPPLIDNYFGPSMEKSFPENYFYAGLYQSDIAKIKDTGSGFVELYYAVVPGAPVGMSYDIKTGMLFAALRTVAGEIAVLCDDGLSLKEMWRLKDINLGCTHDVKLKGDSLYVVEDGISPGGRILQYMEKAKIDPKGKNRISKYKIIFEEEKDFCKISVKK